MSAATARSATRTGPPPRGQARTAAPRVAGARGPLTVVPRRPARVARGPFVVAVVSVLAAGLLGLLALNTVLAQGSFRLHTVQVDSRALADREQQLQHEVDALQAPAALAAQAQAQGMVPGGPPVFLRLPDGAVLGQPVPAAAPPPAATAAPTTAGRSPADQSPPGQSSSAAGPAAATPAAPGPAAAAGPAPTAPAAGGPASPAPRASASASPPARTAR